MTRPLPPLISDADRCSQGPTAKFGGSRLKFACQVWRVRRSALWQVAQYALKRTAASFAFSLATPGAETISSLTLAALNLTDAAVNAKAHRKEVETRTPDGKRSCNSWLRIVTSSICGIQTFGTKPKYDGLRNHETQTVAFCLATPKFLHQRRPNPYYATT